MKNSRIAIMKKCDDNGRLIWFVNKIDIIEDESRETRIRTARKKIWQ